MSRVCHEHFWLMCNIYVNIWEMVILIFSVLFHMWKNVMIVIISCTFFFFQDFYQLYWMKRTVSKQTSLWYWMQHSTNRGILGLHPFVGYFIDVISFAWGPSGLISKFRWIVKQNANDVLWYVYTRDSLLLKKDYYFPRTVWSKLPRTWLEIAIDWSIYPWRHHVAEFHTTVSG